MDRRRRPIDAEAGRIGPFGKRREQQRARAGAEIENPPGSPWPEMRDGRFDQGLTVGARDQHAGGDVEADRPEIAPTDDIGDRFMALSARQERLETLGGCHILPADQHDAAIDPQRLRHQQFGVESGGLAAIREKCRSPRERGANSLNHPIARGARPHPRR